MHYTCVDSFSGAGGLGLGLKKAGLDILLSFDIDKQCINTINNNPKYFKHPAICEDISNMLEGKLLKKIGLKPRELFLLAGGPPCQGFSVQRIGSDKDDRNQLVLKYKDLVKETLPAFFIMENVSGIQGKRGREVLSELIEGLEEIGYVIHKSMFDAQDYGVPQRRKRMILVGERSDIGGEYVFPEAIKEKHTVRETIEFLPPPPRDGSAHPDYPIHRKDRLSPKNLLRIQALNPGEGRDHLPVELLAECHKIDSSVIGHRNVYGRMAWDDVAPTITARFDSFTRGQFGHPEQDRSISLLEGALLQTFPDDFLFTGTKVEIARQIGNAVPPKLAEIIGRSILEYYKQRNE